MKKLTLIFTLLVSTTMFSSLSYAQWTKVGENVSEDIYYVDFERKRKHDGYLYYWQLTDYFEPTEYGYLSSKIYVQGDCKLFRYKYLRMSFHRKQMGGGSGNVISEPQKNWTYPTPNSVSETVLKSVCN